MNGAMKPPLAASTCTEIFFPVLSSYSSDISKSLPLVHSDQCTCYHDYHILESAFIHVGECYKRTLDPLTQRAFVMILTQRTFDTANTQ